MHGGGISTYCYFTAAMLSAAGHEVTVIVNDDSVSNTTTLQLDQNIRLIRFNPNRPWLQQCLGYSAKLSYVFALVVKEMIETEGKPDIIEAQDYLGIGYYLTQFKHGGYPFLESVPLVITLHSPAFIYLEYNRVPLYRFPDFWTGEMEKQAIAAADLVLSPTQFLINEVSKAVPAISESAKMMANPYLVTHSVEPGFERNRIVYYGKLSAQKGSFELLHYFKDLWDDGFTNPLHIIGGTDIVYHPEMSTMGELVTRTYASYLSRGLLQLHGKIPPSTISRALATAHLVIVPSIVDNMPYVVMEAMSIGKVVLASVQGGQREMIEDGVSGFLFDHNDPDSFGRQLKKILALRDEEVKAIGQNAAKRIAEHYSFEVIGEQKISLIQQTLRSSTQKTQFPFLWQEPVKPLQEVECVPGLLSVVIPYFNLGQYIDECIASVKRSSYEHIEIIIVNDGSTDRASIEKAEILGAQKQITLLNRKNSGLAATRNAGAAVARGQYLAFLDADDKVAPDYYEKAIAVLSKKSNVFFIAAWSQYFENSKRLWPAFTPQGAYPLLHNPVNSSALVYKRVAFLTGGLNDKRVDYGLEDYESLVQMLANGFNGVVLPEPLFYYRVRSGSMFRNITRPKLLYSNRYIAEKHQAYFSRFAVPLINLLNANGPGFLYDNPTFETTISVENQPPAFFLNTLKAFVKRNGLLKNMALKILKLKNKR